MNNLIPKEVFQNKLAEKYRNKILAKAPVGTVAVETPVLDALQMTAADRKKLQDEQRKKDNASVIRGHRLRK